MLSIDERRDRAKAQNRLKEKVPAPRKYRPAEKASPRVNSKTLFRIIDRLDPESQSVVGYLRQYKHATIDELVDLCDASTDMNVLAKIKEVINPLAERVIGRPLLSFETSKVDLETGEKFLFSWWIVDGEWDGIRRGSLFDMIDERDYLRITMELFGAREETIRLKVIRNKLILSAGSSPNYYQEEILLPIETVSQSVSRSYKNGILEVRIKK